MSSVAGTNYCFIGLDVDEIRKRIVVFSVLDNLGKGGAQAGVENMNVMFGFSILAVKTFQEAKKRAFEYSGNKLDSNA